MKFRRFFLVDGSASTAHLRCTNARRTNEAAGDLPVKDEASDPLAYLRSAATPKIDSESNEFSG